MDRLRQIIASLEGKSYKSYKQLQGDYDFTDFRLRIDHVQGDPFATPSRCRIFIDADVTKIPRVLYRSPCCKVALEDFLGRSFTAAISRHVKGGRGSGVSGEMWVVDYGQQVLVRNAVLVNTGAIELRLQIGLPANKRTIDAKQAAIMLLDELPNVIAAGIEPIVTDIESVTRHVNSVECQQGFRAQLVEKGLVAFIADDSCLARQSGIDERPLNDAVLSQAPDSLAVNLRRPDGSLQRGLGLSEGITLIVGGGFHGKSTLLYAIERGVYDHIPGDGREGVVAVANAVKIRAEDRRAISQVDISPFISQLPQGKDTRCFSTQDASGSTSQAANIMEALSADSELLLIDEDTSATNFMIRDERMQALVSKDKEPITPLVQRISDLKSDNGVSVILVMGGSGDFFASADTVIMLDNYQIKDVTEQAQVLAKLTANESQNLPTIVQTNQRRVRAACLSPQNQFNKDKIQALETHILRYGDSEVDVSQIEQLVDVGQLNAIGYLIKYLHQNSQRLEVETEDLNSVLGAVLAEAEQQGLDCLTPYVIGTLAMPRLYELVATVNRMRNLELI